MLLDDGVCVGEILKDTVVEAVALRVLVGVPLEVALLVRVGEGETVGVVDGVTP